jgi:hypothetical protein
MKQIKVVQCDTPDKCRITPVCSSMTDAYYPPTYDGHGNNINPDRNTVTTQYKCWTCGKEWVTQEYAFEKADGSC